MVMKIARILLFIFSTSVCSALRCYVCTSKRDARCADPFNNATLGADLRAEECRPGALGDSLPALEAVGNLLTVVGQSPQLPAPAAAAPDNAPAAPAACQKIVLTVLGETMTGRGCTSGRAPCDAIKLTATSDVVVRYCGACDTDGCNRADRGRRGLPWLLAAALAVVFS